MKDSAKTSQQKRQRIPTQLQIQVYIGIEKLLKDGHFEKVDKLEIDVIIQPTVISVLKNKSVKLPLESRAVKESIANDKYQMRNLDYLIDMIAEN